METVPMSHEAFERDWLKRHKGSIVYRPRISSWGLIFGIGLWGLIAAGAALVSGAHSVPAILQTIPVVVSSPFREVLSLFGFTIVELLIFAGSLYRHTSKTARYGLWISMVGALAANVGSSVHAVAVNGGDTLSLVVALVLAVIAPLTAYIAGEVIYHLVSKHREYIVQKMAEYEVKRKDLDALINREYTKYLKQFEVLKPVPLSIPAHSNGTERNGTDSRPALGHSKASNAWNTVMEYFANNPDALSRDGRLIAEELGVGKSTVYKARSDFQKNGYSNGNGNGNHHTDEEGIR